MLMEILRVVGYIIIGLILIMNYVISYYGRNNETGFFAFFWTVVLLMCIGLMYIAAETGTLL